MDSFNFAQLTAVFTESLSLIKHSKLVDVEARDERTFIFTLQKDQQSHRLLICLQTPFIRFHLITKTYKNIPSPWIHQLKEILVPSKIEDCHILNHDRILKWTCRKGHHVYQMVVEFFNKSPNIYLLNDKNEILLSLSKTSKTVYALPEKPSLSIKETAVLTNLELEKKFLQLESQSRFEKEKNEILNRYKNEIKTRQRRLEKAYLHLKECEKWEEVQHLGVLLQSNLYQWKELLQGSAMKVFDWERDDWVTVELSSKDPQITVQKLFQKSKKLRKGLEQTQQQIDRLNQERQEYEELLLQCEAFTSQNELKTVERQKDPLPVKRPYKEFISASGLKIWVGKTAKDNDVLTFKLAKGSDYWLHVRDYTGAHVVISCPKKTEPDAECLQDALQLALHYSQAKDGSAEVCVTQRKYLLKLGKAGKVQISKHRVLFVQFDAVRWQQIKNGVT